ncbi:MAG: hypothetical protein ACRDKA_10620 [Actinomycetota bacterium]
MDLKRLLDEKAEEMRLDRRIPRSVLRRARRRRAGTAALAGAMTVGLALGVVVGIRALLQETSTGPRETTPAGPSTAFYPFIYPPTQEELEVTREQVAQGSMPMWTDPEGTAILFAVNVLGWDMNDVEVDVQGSGEDITAVIRNHRISLAAGSGRDIGTTLFLSRIPPPGPRMFAVLAADAEGFFMEPIGPDDEFGSDGRIAFRGSLGFIPEGARVTLTVDGGSPVSVSAPDGLFEIEAQAPGPVGPSTLISVAVQDGSGNTIALTSSRVASPVTSGTETGASEPQLAIPGRVAETRDAILAAAQARAWEALRALIPDEGFTFSFGGETDPIAYWRRLESEGHEPVIGDILPSVLGTEPGFDRGVFVWPAQATEDPAEWDEQDLQTLRQIHADEDIQSFQELGTYLGWRAGIARDGTWLFFVAGD